MSLEWEREIPDKVIGEIFDDNILKFFVQTFYSEMREWEYVGTSSAIYREIFTDDTLYREFMLYCRERDFPFTRNTWEKRDAEITLFLWLFESVRDEILGNLHDVLDMKESEFVSIMQNEWLSEEATDNMWDWLEKAIKIWVPVNDLWEVLYFLREMREWSFTVYSHQSWTHMVDGNGGITYSPKTEKQRIRDEVRDTYSENRRELQETLQKLKKFQKMLEEDTLHGKDENHILAAEVINTFITETWTDLDAIKNNPLELRTFRLKLRFFVLTRVMEINNWLIQLRREYLEQQDYLYLAWWRDVEQ